MRRASGSGLAGVAAENQGGSARHERNQPFIEKRASSRSGFHQKDIARAEIQNPRPLERGREKHRMVQRADHRRRGVLMTSNRGCQRVGGGRVVFFRLQVHRVPLLIDHNAATVGGVEMGRAVRIANNQSDIVGGESLLDPVGRRSGIDGETGIPGFPDSQQGHGLPCRRRKNHRRMPTAGDTGFFKMRSEFVGHRLEIRVGDRILPGANGDRFRGSDGVTAEGINDRATMSRLRRTVGPLSECLNFLGKKNRQAINGFAARIGEAIDQESQSRKDFLCTPLRGKRPGNREFEPGTGARLQAKTGGEYRLDLTVEIDPARERGVDDVVHRRAPPHEGSGDISRRKIQIRRTQSLVSLDPNILGNGVFEQLGGVEPLAHGALPGLDERKPVLEKTRFRRLTPGIETAHHEIARCPEAAEQQCPQATDHKTLLEIVVVTEFRERRRGSPIEQKG